MRKLIISCFALLMLSACAPSAESIQAAIAQTQAAWTAIPTQTAFATYTAPPTVFVTVISTVIVTETFTPAPLFTPTTANTPEPTRDPLTASRGDGFYLVGTDIAPGVWRSTGTATDCYWSVTTANGDIIDNHFGQSGGTAYIATNAFQVEFEGCGNFEYISGP